MRFTTSVMEREKTSLQDDLARPAAALKSDDARDRKAVPWTRSVPSRAQMRGLKIEALFREAAVSFHRNGYAGTSLADVAARLGTSKAALYYYIDNKQALLLGCHMAASDAADAVIEQVPKTGLTGLQKLHMALRLHVESILSENSPSLLALEESALTQENFRAVVQRRDCFQSAFVRFIREGVADGSIVDCDPKLAAFAVLGGVNWVEKWYRPGGAWSSSQIGQAMADVLVRGLAAATTSTLLSRVIDYPDEPNTVPPPPSSPVASMAGATKRSRGAVLVAAKRAGTTASDKTKTRTGTTR